MMTRRTNKSNHFYSAGWEGLDILEDNVWCDSCQNPFIHQGDLGKGIPQMHAVAVGNCYSQ